MNTVILELSDDKNMNDIHSYLRENLAFPEYYGNNLDALFDVLSTWDEDLCIEIHKNGEKSWKRLLNTLEDAAEENEHIQVVLIEEDTEEEM